MPAPLSLTDMTFGFLGVHIQVDAAARRRVFLRIVQKVVQRLRKPARIGIDLYRLLGTRYPQRLSLLRGGESGGVDRVRHDVGDAGAYFHEAQRVMVHARRPSDLRPVAHLRDLAFDHTERAQCLGLAGAGAPQQFGGKAQWR